MPTTDNAPLFVMHGARAAIARGLLHIEEQVKALELAVVENPGLAFDLARVLVESTCRTIIASRGRQYGKDDDLGKLFKAAAMCVPFLPSALSNVAAARKSLQQTMSGLSTALQGVCELRNACGFASHGSESPRPSMDAAHALLAAQAADAIVGFIYRVHIDDLSREVLGPLEYEDNAEFNQWLDDQCEAVHILALPPYQPSEVLFAVDREAYRNVITEYQAELVGQAADEDALLEGSTAQ